MPSTTDPGERLVAIASEHWIRFVFPVCMYVVLNAAAIMLYILAGISVHHEMWLSHVALIGGIGLLLLTHHWFFHWVLSEVLDAIIITNRRVLFAKTNLLFDDNLFEIQLDKVQAITAKSANIVQAILRYGELEFRPAGRIKLVSHPQRAARAIQQALGMI